MGVVTIMRGLPGSGKSTLARQLVGYLGVVCSTDDFFIDEDGVYRHCSARLPEAHAWNLSRFRTTVLSGVPRIAVDNTNIRVAHFMPYIEFATMHSYRVHVVAVETALGDEELAARSLHGVPVGVVRAMREAWEPYR